jgi:outer membrane protein TolC
MTRRTTVLLTAASVFVALALAGRPASAKKFTLPQLLELARDYPGLQASAAATAAMEAQVTEAKANWLPQGDILSLLAPSPNVRCQPPRAGENDPTPCLTTSSAEASLRTIQWTQVFTRTEVKLIQPVFDFGKISAGIAAAKAGVEVARQREAGARADLEMNVRKAYYGLKFAREVLDMLDTGSGYVDDGQKQLEKDLAKGTGNATVTDKLRMKTVRAELDARILEAKRMQGVARESLRILIGPEAPADIDVDDEPFEAPQIQERPVSYYEDIARASRPEVRMLEYAVRAKHALADLERRKEYPDLVLIGTAAFARAQGVDDPPNAFMSHYFNSTTAGVAAALRMQLDLGPKIARARKTAAEALEVEYRRAEALGGVLLDVRKAYGEMTEAQQRTDATAKGEKAGRAWIQAVSQNFTIGLAEARDFSDALIAFFNMRGRYLQSVFDLNVAISALGRAIGTPVATSVAN